MVNISSQELSDLQRRAKGSAAIVSGKPTVESMSALAQPFETTSAGLVAPLSLLTGPFKASPKDVVLTCVIAGEPLAKDRPRFNRRGGAYTPRATRDREDDIAAIVKTNCRELVVDDLSLFSVRAAFYLGSNQARDIDNMLKLVLDALTRVVWQDDRQVVEVFGLKMKADRSDEARTDIAVIRMRGVMPYTMTKCLACCRLFRTYPSWGPRPFCSRACCVASQRRTIAKDCRACGKTFLVKRYRASVTRFCSQECRRSFGRKELTCPVCGKTFMVARWQARRKTCSLSCAATFRQRQRLLL